MRTPGKVLVGSLVVGGPVVGASVGLAEGVTVGGSPQDLQSFFIASR